MWAGGGGVRDKVSQLGVKSTRVFHDLDSASVLTLRRKTGNQNTGPDHVLESSPSPNPSLPGPGCRGNGERGRAFHTLCPAAPSPWFLLPIAEPPRA